MASPRLLGVAAEPASASLGIALFALWRIHGVNG